MGNGLTFDPSTRTVTGMPTAAAETVVYTYTATDSDSNEARLTFSVAVFDVDVTVVGDLNRVGNQGLVGHWSVWDTASATVSVSITRPDGYQFRVAVPASAGFQVNSTSCTWPVAAPTSQSTLWSRWVLQNESFDLVRCGLGSGNIANIEVWVKLGERGTPSRLYSAEVTIPQVWHAHDNTVDYYVVGTGESPSATRVTGVEQGTSEGMFPSTRPSNLAADYTPNDALLVLANYDDAAGAWTDANAGVTIERVYSDAGTDVLIEGYWEPGELDDDCGGSVACFVPSGTYPHIGEENRLLIEDPPRWPGDYEAMPQIPARKWTIDLQEYIRKPREYVYLPGILMHEFGHTIGLWHGGSNSIMTGHYSRGALSTDDEEGAKAIYEHHTAHDEVSP